MNFNAPYNYEEGALFLVDKPLHWTSFDVVNKLRFALRKATGNKKIKVGHAGTLDPLASGLLLICSGKYTKSIDSLQAQEKEYTGTIKLGATTPSYDAESAENAHFPFEQLTESEIRGCVALFLGDIEQYPPAFSAIKVDGKPLYLAARKGEEVQLKARPVKIFDFEITNIELPFVDFKVKCSKGTYIRSLAHDFGKALNSGGYLTALRRTKIGTYNVDDAWKLDELVDFVQK
jgi:tRNA pseudouridine55 synthase